MKKGFCWRSGYVPDLKARVLSRLVGFIRTLNFDETLILAREHSILCDGSACIRRLW
ncbi:hypothetical protein BN873_1010005 [Candidatus Competibacter denitrificans Run_A_D11]|uniref:Uncharacterized protein n=1 Tax=Candidatus Competibacter denitrificans Run_A_D11 TaxID=1400863 RepID=W6M105_9GAMM|nr:hypothetical protein BN873_1010005 [Candidatus Competibacter denitrificans Run_A_D11]